MKINAKERRLPSEAHVKALRAWYSMRKRCFNKNSPYYRNYGGRGITVSDKWETFEAFLSDVGLPPVDPRISLDRIDNNGDYAPGNVRWATLEQQARNRRDTKLNAQLVAAIRMLDGLGVRNKDIASGLGLTGAIVSSVCSTRAIWKDVRPTIPELRKNPKRIGYTRDYLRKGDASR